MYVCMRPVWCAGRVNMCEGVCVWMGGGGGMCVWGALSQEEGERWTILAHMLSHVVYTVIHYLLASLIYCFIRLICQLVTMCVLCVCMPSCGSG